MALADSVGLVVLGLGFEVRVFLLQGRGVIVGRCLMLVSFRNPCFGMFYVISLKMIFENRK